MEVLTGFLIVCGLIGAVAAMIKGGWFMLVGLGFAAGSLLPKLVQTWRGSESAVGVSLLLDVSIAAACILAIARMEGDYATAPKLSLLIVSVLCGLSIFLHAYFYLGLAAGSHVAMVIYTAMTSTAWLFASLALVFSDHIGKRIPRDVSDLSVDFGRNMPDRDAYIPVNRSRREDK